METQHLFQLEADPQQNSCTFEDGMVGVLRERLCYLNDISTDAQAVSMAAVPKITAAVSGLSTLVLLVFLFRHSGRQDEIKKNIVVDKGLLVGGCLSHLVATIAWFATTWPIPSMYSNDDADDEWFWNVGSETSCRVQGFLAQLSLATVVYTVGAVLLLAMPQFTRLLRNAIHVFAWGIALGTAGIAGTLDMFQPQEWMCWVGPPSLAEDCHRNEMSDCTLERVYRYVLRDALVWLCLFVSIGVILFVAFCRKCAPEYRRSHLGGNASSAQERHFLKQTIGVILSLLVCWVPLLAIYLYQDITGASANFWPRLIAVALLPCQGLWVWVLIGRSVVKVTRNPSSIPGAHAAEKSQRTIQDDENCPNLVFDMDEEIGDLQVSVGKGVIFQ